MAQPVDRDVRGAAEAHVVGMSHYPAPAKHFVLTPNAESLWLRYVGFLEGREPLLSMAYFCLTVLESASGSRGAASKRYRISEKVLRKLGELTATRGDRLSARKATARPQQSLSGAESAWIQSVVKALILRAGEEIYADSSYWIDFPDLPAI